MNKDRRRDERFFLRLPTEIEVINANVSKVVYAMSVNVSAGGGFFWGKQALKTKVQVRVTLDLLNKKIKEISGHQGRLMITGKVVRLDAEGFAVCFDGEYELQPITGERMH